MIIEIHLPQADQIFNIHEHLIARDGGLPGIREGESVEAVLGRVESNLYYRLDNPASLDAAALITYALAVGHVFNDANKRTAYFCGMVTLELNGTDTRLIQQIKLEEIVINAASGMVNMDEFMIAYKALL